MTDTNDMTCKQAKTLLGDAATRSIWGELQQLVDNESARPVMPVDTTSDIRGAVSRTKMFSKAKSRLVARCYMQKKEDYVGKDLSASTSDCMSVFTVIAMATSERRHLMAADIVSAYINAPMDYTSPAAYISIEPRLSQILAEIDPSYEMAIKRNGTITAGLKKCIYGCIESAKRGQTHVVTAPKGMGFEDDTHVGRTLRGSSTRTTTLMDDLLITSEPLEDTHAVRDAVIAVCKEVKSQDGPRVEFLGMSIDVSTPGTASITMDGMVQKIIADSLTDKLSFTTKSLAGDDLFDTLTESPLLDEKRRRPLRTMAARLQYLSRRVKPEIQLAVAILATRVTKATELDQSMPDGVIQYLHQSHENGQRSIWSACRC
jgi:hypothetical protein